MVVSKSNNVEKNATRRTQYACAELKNRIRMHPHVQI